MGQEDRRDLHIERSRVWFLPLAQHLGALILVLLGLFGYFLVFSMSALRLIHEVYVNMSPRMAVMVVGKVSSGLLQPACRTLQVLGVGDDSLDLVADLVDRGAVGLVVRVKGRARGFSLRGDHSQPDVPLVANMARR